jgi:hypothetical protein
MREMCSRRTKGQWLNYGRRYQKWFSVFRYPQSMHKSLQRNGNTMAVETVIAALPSTDYRALRH